jgi:hypothetical protein
VESVVPHELLVKEAIVSVIPIIWKPLPVNSTVRIDCAANRPCALTFTEATPGGVKPDWAVPIPSTLDIATPSAGNYVIAVSVDFLEPSPAITTVTFTISGCNAAGEVIKASKPYSLSGKRGDPTNALFLLFRCV